MHPKTHSSLQRMGWLSLAMMAAGMTGCSSFNLPQLPTFSLNQSEPKYISVDSGVELQGATSEELYHKVRQARAQNSIVLQVIGDETPVRVLPLPPGEKSVFVSNLLTQTGVQRKLGAVDAVLFRHSPDTIGGIRMVVKMSSDKRTVRPESDYALRAGDRLRVEKAASPGLQELIQMTLGF